MEFTADHYLTKGVYFFDPDGNRLEIFCESMEMAAACHRVNADGKALATRTFILDSRELLRGAYEAGQVIG